MTARPLTAAAVAEQVRTGGLAPMDLVEEFLAHASRVEPEIHAFCTLDEGYGQVIGDGAVFPDIEHPARLAVFDCPERAIDLR
ncbi:hypothetical protein ACTMTI_41550 [Nonomuraea sp. H19]|uniref:hypothetical protein n=1 Tax=Nonomuraea sp. H19 TaxID=3452206 RepID=UPI003F8BBC77